MFIDPPASSDATRRLFDSNAKSQGFVMNLTRAWAWRPEVYEGFTQLRTQLTSGSRLSRRDQAVIVCATAGQLGDSYCCLAWGKTLAEESSSELAAAVVTGADASPMTPRDRALAAWARQVVKDPNGTRAADIDALHAAGFDDRDIFDATVFIAFRLAFSTVNDALGARPDAQVAQAAPAAVREAVRFGRAVADAPSASHA